MCHSCDEQVSAELYRTGRAVLAMCGGKGKLRCFQQCALCLTQAGLHWRMLTLKRQNRPISSPSS